LEFLRGAFARCSTIFVNLDVLKIIIGIDRVATVDSNRATGMVTEGIGV
jgi:hypothetical protein